MSYGPTFWYTATIEAAEVNTETDLVAVEKDSTRFQSLVNYSRMAGEVLTAVRIRKTAGDALVYNVYVYGKTAGVGESQDDFVVFSVYEIENNANLKFDYFEENVGVITTLQDAAALVTVLVTDDGGGGNASDFYIELGFSRNISGA